MRKLLYILLCILLLVIVGAAGLLFVLFTGNLHPEFGIDRSVDEYSLPIAIGVNFGLIVLFGVQHSVMARESFKEHLKKWLAVDFQRIVYSLFSGLVMLMMVLFWQPIPILIWDIELEWLQTILYTLFFLGWFLVMASSFLTGAFDLIGLKQLIARLTDKNYKEIPFKTPLFYKLIRHPLYLGFLIAFWATPLMTLSHLVFSFGMTIYIFIGIHYEEKDLKRRFGQSYADYIESTPMLFPRKISID